MTALDEVAKQGHSVSLPELHLTVHLLAHEGAHTFFRHFRDASDLLIKSIDCVISILYMNNEASVPVPRSVNLIVRPFDGVAYTTSHSLDSAHKEIHLSSKYISGKDADEIRGVIVHEMVHVYQYNGSDSAPSPWIEGVADFVRLRVGLGAKHWSQKPGDKWDASYDKTALFLDWVEKQYPGFVASVNLRLDKEEWKEEMFKEHCAGLDVQELWKAYVKWWEEKGEPSSANTASAAVPTRPANVPS